MSDTGSELAKKLRDECNGKNKSTDSVEISDDDADAEDTESPVTGNSDQKRSVPSNIRTNFAGIEGFSSDNSQGQWSSVPTATNVTAKTSAKRQNNVSTYTLCFSKPNL